jgi:hypothetical protein
VTVETQLPVGGALHGREQVRFLGIDREPLEIVSELLRHRGAHDGNIITSDSKIIEILV